MSKRDTGSDLAKVDAYQNTAADYEEIPELDDAFFEKAAVRRMGRPPIGGTSKKQITLRLDHDVIEHYRRMGPGWQSKMNDVLRIAAEADREKHGEMLKPLIGG